MRRLASFALAVSLVACAGAPAEMGPITPNPLVTIEGVAFKPPVVTIETGDTVTWVWRDGQIQHDVAADQFRSDLMTEGAFSHTFDYAGLRLRVHSPWQHEWHRLRPRRVNDDAGEKTPFL